MPVVLVLYVMTAILYVISVDSHGIPIISGNSIPIHISSTDSAKTLSRMKLFGYVGHATIFS